MKILQILEDFLGEPQSLRFQIETLGYNDQWIVSSG